MKFVLDHIAKPFIKDNLMDPWQEDIKKLASFPNVHCKLSGMVTEKAKLNSNHEDFEKYLQVVYCNFGASRLMIGSDFPVCRLSKDYVSTMNIVLTSIKKITKK